MFNRQEIVANSDRDAEVDAFAAFLPGKTSNNDPLSDDLFGPDLVLRLTRP